jgi:hypothetical protein
VTGALAAAGVADARQTPVLGAVFGSNQQGFGHAHPSHLYAGGDPTSIVKRIHWRHWGAAHAVAHHATAFWVPPQGPVAAGHFAKATVIASDLGSCGGRRAYRKVEWYFPGHGGRRGGVYGFGPRDMCGA